MCNAIKTTKQLFQEKTHFSNKVSQVSHKLVNTCTNIEIIICLGLHLKHGVEECDWNVRFAENTRDTDTKEGMEIFIHKFELTSKDWI